MNLISILSLLLLSFDGIFLGIKIMTCSQEVVVFLYFPFHLKLFFLLIIIILLNSVIVLRATYKFLFKKKDFILLLYHLFSLLIHFSNRDLLFTNSRPFLRNTFSNYLLITNTIIFCYLILFLSFLKKELFIL